MLEFGLLAEIFVSIFVAIGMGICARPVVENAPTGFVILFIPLMLAAILAAVGFRIACWVPLAMLILGFILPGGGSSGDFIGHPEP